MLRHLLHFIPSVNFINILRAAFTLTEPKSVKKIVNSLVFLRFQDLRAQKLRVNMMVKLTPNSYGQLKIINIYCTFTFQWSYKHMYRRLVP